MTYVDGFLIPVPEARKADYLRLAEMAAPIFLEYGALEVVETWGDDLIKGETTDFYRAVKAEEGENVVFSWIVWPSKEARDAGNRKAMADPRMENFSPAPLEVFNGKRMIFSGFQTILAQRA